jgi:hypothetical protein
MNTDLGFVLSVSIRGYESAHQMSGDVLRPVTADNTVHLVF